MLTNARESSLQYALKKVNEKYDDNIIFNNFQFQGNRIRFTLRVVSSKGKGHRLGMLNEGKQRRLFYACWHVHGDFFEHLFDIEPEAYVWSRGNKITQYEGNWEDYNIGSFFNPLYMSSACDCNS